MSDITTQDKPETPRDGIPAPLLDNLHEANEQFRRAKEHVEKANGALVNPLDERERAAREVHEAERAVEEVEQKIEKELGKT
jgi:hypothetical protein